MIVKVDLARILRAALRGLPDTSLASVRQGADRTKMTVRSAGHSYHLEALWAGEGWPSDVPVSYTHLTLPTKRIV